MVQTYLALSPAIEQTSFYSGWVGKLLALAGDHWPAQYKCCCCQCCCCCHQPCLYLYFLLHCVTALAACLSNYLKCDKRLSEFGLMDAGACLLTRALLSFKRWGDETPKAGRFFAIFAALLVELTIDNAFTWYMHSLETFTGMPCMVIQNCTVFACEMCTSHS